MARGVGSGFGLSDLPRIAYGKGSYLYDQAGKAYLDGSGGPAVFCLGHAHPEVNSAISTQLESIAYAYRYLFTSAALESLNETVLRLSGGGFKDVLYSADGSEAVESALKVALQYFAARGLMKKRRFIARRRSWHGNTLGALSVSGFAARRRAFEGSLLDAIFVSAANAYRPPPDCEPGALVSYLAAELEQAILDAGPDTVAAFIFEPIVGAAGGVVPAPPGYAAAVARGVSQIRCSGDRGRGHVRRRPQRHLARARARWCGARHHERCQGPRRRLHPARSDAGRCAGGRPHRE